MDKLSNYDGCYCRKCLKVSDVKVGQWPVAGMMMIVCKTCGNKRCPHATDCSLKCTGSNQPGQSGSFYEHRSAKQEPAT